MNPAANEVPSGGADYQEPVRHAWEWYWVAALALIAGARVFLGSAALPFFNNVDEQAHFDLVHKYARGYWPARKMTQRRQPNLGDRYDEEAATTIVLYGSPEYLGRPEEFPNNEFPPPTSTLPTDEQNALVTRRVHSVWRANINYEAFSPPVYYLVAGGWYDLGRLLGLHGIKLLYWIRFLNVPIYVTLVVLAYCSCRRFYPDQRLLRLGVPLLLAFYSQDVFYSINPDVLSPLCYLICVALLLEWYGRNQSSRFASALCGLAIGLTVLVKYTNIGLLAILGLIAIRKAVRLHRRSMLWEQAGQLVLVGFMAALPIGIWLVRNKVLLGDFWGTEAKMLHLTWTHNSLEQVFNHPLFTAAGLGHFPAELARTFWRGEIVWHQEKMANKPIDPYFVWTSGLLLSAAVLRWIACRGKDPDDERGADGLSLASVAVSVLVLMVLSVSFDFGSCPHPSSSEPYFYNGRLISGVLVPFLVLYVRGAQFLFARVAPIAGPVLVLGATVAMMTFSKLESLLAASQSAYNFFHLS